MAVFPMVPLKHAIETRFTGVWGSDEGADEVDVPCVRIADFNRETKTAGEAIPTVRSLPEKVLSDKCLRTFDILLEKSGGGEKTPVGDAMLYVGAGEVVCANFIEVIRPKSDSDSRYLVYSLGSNYSSGSTRPFVRQTIGIQNLDLQRYFDQAIPLPDLDTQRRIADYLDAETAQIDTLTAELDGYVELLVKRNKAVIDSLLMGDYPTVSLGLVAESIGGLTYKPDEIVSDGGTCVYRSGNVQNSRIDRSDMVRVSTPIPPKLRFEEGDILMCSRNGSAHLVGKNARVESQDLGESWGAFMTVVRSRFNPFLYWFFRSSAFDAERGNFSTSTINQLTSGILNRISLPLPDLDTQRRIADYLDKETAKTDTIITQCRELKELLLKRRQVLITDVVTGKVEV